MTKALKHIELMQSKARDYLMSLSNYHEYGGTASAHHTDTEGRDCLFLHDMLHLLDGPEQREAQFDYLALSERTASGHFHAHLINYAKFMLTLEKFIGAAQELDRYKKLMFYGEDLRRNRVADAGQRDGRRGSHILTRLLKDLPANAEYPKFIEETQFLVHAIIGVATEAGEMTEMLFNSIQNETMLDTVNLMEESGDAKWYMAMMARVAGVDWDHDERINIAKLKARFPEKFTTKKANKRDLNAERDILEGK